MFFKKKKSEVLEGNFVKCFKSGIIVEKSKATGIKTVQVSGNFLEMQEVRSVRYYLPEHAPKCDWIFTNHTGDHFYKKLEVRADGTPKEYGAGWDTIKTVLDIHLAEINECLKEATAELNKKNSSTVSKVNRRITHDKKS